MFRLFQFWRVDASIRSYLDEIANRHSRTSLDRLRPRLLLLLFTLQAIHLTVITFLPLSEFWRFLNFDVTLFWSAPQSINLLNLTMCFEMINIIYQGYSFDFRARDGKRRLCDSLFFSPLLLLKQTILGHRDTTFLSRRIGKRRVLVLDRLDTYMRAIRVLNQNVVYFICLVNLHYEFSVIPYYAKWWRHFLTEASGIASFLYLQVNQFGIRLELNFGVLINLTIATILYAFTCIAFIRLQQGNELLRRRNLNSRDLGLFTRYHTQTVLLVIGSNQLFGGLVLGFIVSGLPINSYFALLLSMGTFNRMVTFIFSVIFTFQLIVILGFHLLAAMYSSRIHVCSKRLFHWSSVPAEASSRDLSYRLKLAHYIEKFHTIKPYGVNYGSFGSISFYSFAKFILLYTELLMYWYRFIRDIH